jgi:hypothetical protein
MTKKAMVSMIRELINEINEVRAEYKNYIENTYSNYSSTSPYVLGLKCDAHDNDSIRFFEVEEMTDNKIYRVYDNMDMQILIDSLKSVLDGCTNQLQVRQYEINRHLELEAKKNEIAVTEVIKENNNNVEVVENKINYKIVTFVVYNKSFNNKQDAISYCLDNDFDPELMIEKYVDGAKAVDSSNNNNVIPVDANNAEKVQDKIYQSFKMNDTIEYKTISQQIKSLDNEINLLEDKRIQLSNYIRNELNIKCNYNQHLDIKECKEYIHINNLMDIKEAELIQLQSNKKLIASDNFNKYKDTLIKCYDNNKYRIVLHDRIEYSNSIEPYKSLECNVSIFTLINNEKSFIEVLVYKKEYDNNLYNDSYNKVCKLESIYNYCNDKYLLLDESIILNDKLILQLSSRYDNGNNKIYGLMYFNNNNYRECYINMKSNYMIQYDTFNGAENTTVYYNIGLMKTIDYIPVEYQEYINKVNDKLNNEVGLKLIA